MMLDYIYDRPETDYLFCMQSQFDLFSKNDTFIAAVTKTGAELPGQLQSQNIIFLYRGARL